MGSNRKRLTTSVSALDDERPDASRDGSTLDGAWDQTDVAAMSATIAPESPMTRITLASDNPMRLRCNRGEYYRQEHPSRFAVSTGCGAVFGRTMLRLAKDRTSLYTKRTGPLSSRNSSPADRQGEQRAALLPSDSCRAKTISRMARAARDFTSFGAI